METRIKKMIAGYNAKIELCDKQLTESERIIKQLKKIDCITNADELKWELGNHVGLETQRQAYIQARADFDSLLSWLPETETEAA